MGMTSANSEFGTPPEEGPGEALANPVADDGGATILRSSAVMAVGTIISRITGVGRDIALVAALGFGTLADVFTLGNTLPNVVYLLIVGGALGAVFVPQLVRHLHDDADGGDAYANRLLTATMLVLLVLAVTAVIAAPFLVDLYTPSNYSDRENAVATAFARFLLPQIFFYGLYTMLAQVLNSRHHFAMPMFAPIVNNIVVIALFVGFLAIVGTNVTVASITDEQIAILGVGTTLGVVLQSLVLIPVLSRVSFKFRPRFDFRGSGLGHTARLAGWTIAMVLANQVALLVAARLAASANILASQEGAIEQGLTTYDKAYLVFMLPNSVITISIVTAMLPRMSRAAADGDLRKVGDQLADTARLIGSLIVPAAVALIAFGPIITTLVFSFGAGRGTAAPYTGVVVSLFALGLLPFSLFYMLIRGWYALSDTRSPFFVTVLFSLLLVAFMLSLFRIAPTEVKIASLALAESIAYWLTLVVAWWWLARRVGGLHTRQTSWALAKMMLAGGVAGFSGFLTLALLGTYQSQLSTGGGLDWYLNLGLGLIAGCIVLGVVYLLMCRLLRINEPIDLVRPLVGRIPGMRRSGGSS